VGLLSASRSSPCLARRVSCYGAAHQPYLTLRLHSKPTFLAPLLRHRPRSSHRAQVHPLSRPQLGSSPRLRHDFLTTLEGRLTQPYKTSVVTSESNLSWYRRSTWSASSEGGESGTGRVTFQLMAQQSSGRLVEPAAWLSSYSSTRPRCTSSPLGRARADSPNSLVFARSSSFGLDLRGSPKKPSNRDHSIKSTPGKLSCFHSFRRLERTSDPRAALGASARRASSALGKNEQRLTLSAA
jgi:hypothetical protein